jgi:peptidyl-prolyl cis-trans isomerase SurA
MQSHPHKIAQWVAGTAVAAALCLCAGSANAQSTAARQSVKSSPTAQKPVVPMTPPPPMPSVPGQKIDRVVAIVNNDLVLDSGVDEERRFEAFQPYQESEKYSRDRAIERLINRDLILQQAKLVPSDPITDSDVTHEIDDLRKSIPACKQYDCTTDAGWKKFLTVQGFTEAEFDARWKQRMQVLQFIEERFKQGIRISDADIKTYYETKLVPEFKRQGSTAPKLADVSGRIQEVLLEQQVSNLLTDWLQSLRAQGQVVVMHPGEPAP